jgi:hypothetical protein
VIPGEREITIPQSAKFGQDSSLRRRIAQAYCRRPRERVENHRGMFSFRQPRQIALHRAFAERGRRSRCDGGKPERALS